MNHTLFVDMVNSNELLFTSIKVFQKLLSNQKLLTEHIKHKADYLMHHMLFAVKQYIDSCYRTA